VEIVEWITVEELCELIRAEWSDAMSDNGHVWSEAKRALCDGLARADKITKVKAFELAYEQNVIAS